MPNRTTQVTTLNYRFLCFSELRTDLLAQRQPTSLNRHFGSITLSHNLQPSWICFSACKAASHGNRSFSCYYQYYYKTRILHWLHWGCLGQKSLTAQGKEPFYILARIKSNHDITPQKLCNKHYVTYCKRANITDQKANKNNSFSFFCACLPITPLPHFFFLPLNAMEKMLKLTKLSVSKRLIHRKRILLRRTYPYFHYSSTQNCLGWGKITISLSQRCRLPVTHKGTLSLWRALVKPL